MDRHDARQLSQTQRREISVSIDHDKIAGILREAAAEEILPLWQNLQDHQIEQKSPGDMVTAADRACEERLAKALPALLPGSRLLGEESVHRDNSLMKLLDSPDPIWVVDPLDGTGNFAAGEGPIAVMACLIRQGQTLGAWILDPVEDTLLQAEVGAGAQLDSTPLSLTPFTGEMHDIQGALATGYLPEHLKPRAISGAKSLGPTRASGCAGYDYRALVRGDYQFVFYYRTLIWDHAPGVLIASEAGAHTGRYNDSEYKPTDKLSGLICAADANTWATVRDLLVPSEI